MKDTIKQVLIKMRSHFGDSVFTEPSKFRHALADFLGDVQNGNTKIIRNLLNVAICDMNAYARIKSNPQAVNVLISLMNTDYMIELNAAQAVISSIGEFLGHGFQVHEKQNNEPQPQVSKYVQDSNKYGNEEQDAETLRNKYRNSMENFSPIKGYLRIKKDTKDVVAGLRDITIISSKGKEFVALQRDGNVVFCSFSGCSFCQLGWHDVTDIVEYNGILYGLTRDKTIVTSYMHPKEEESTRKIIYGMRTPSLDEQRKSDHEEISGWRNIIALSVCSSDNVFGLRSDGTVAAITSWC